MERAERERREAEERGALDALSEEQREEVNEAVSLTASAPTEQTLRRHPPDPKLTLCALVLTLRPRP